MWKTIICDDEKDMRDAVRVNLERFSEETGERFSVTELTSGEALLFNLTEDVDIVFLDIKMGGITGMDAARKLREKNSHVCIVFITTMTQYAIEGYEVHAFGFLKKPVSYAQFRLQMADVLRHLAPVKKESIQIRSGGEIYTIALPDLVYLEVVDHDLKVVCTTGTIVCRASMGETEKKLAGKGFFRIHKGYCVNLAHVSRVTADGLRVSSGDELPVSKHRRREFLEAYASYIGGGVL
ncbi:MAG: response regulator transcription factor [Firmicutes bacterium]|nr:response regulator transcription factor [Bacillota bacterium]